VWNTILCSMLVLSVISEEHIYESKFSIWRPRECCEGFNSSLVSYWFITPGAMSDQALDTSYITQAGSVASTFYIMESNRSPSAIDLISDLASNGKVHSPCTCLVSQATDIVLPRSSCLHVTLQ
jgi:hypothetical protein